MQDIYTQRSFVLQGSIILVGIILIARLLQLQVLSPDFRAEQSKQPIYPSRGLIYDRNGKQLVYNEATYDLMVTYSEAKKIDTTKLCELLGINKEQYLAAIEKDFKDKRYNKDKPYEFYRNIPASVYSRFAEHLYEFSGFEGVLRNVRGYNIGVGAHVLGYISEVTPKQIDETKKKYDNGEAKNYYESGDYIGMSGLEQSYEEVLAGVKGERKILKDNMGRIRGSFRNGSLDVPATAGLYIISTLDIDLQAYGEELMKNKKGAVVAIEPSTGEILALISSPTYDPNLLTITHNRGEAYDELARNDSLKPLFNRAIQSKYPPGSTFKPLMALIGLQEGVLTNETGFPCAHGWNHKGLHVGCHGHPYPSNPGIAIQYSCNAYFCQTFREVVEKYGYENAERGLDSLVSRLRKFGIGRKLGIDIPGEVAGNYPNSEYFNRIYRKGGWAAPTIISLGIGQGELETTPLQMANVTAAIANKGFYYTPHLVKELKAAEDYKDPERLNEINEVLHAKYRIPNKTGVDTSHFAIVIEGMENVVLAGTATRSRISNLTMCGKTGTVENPHGEDHSTFIAFAPKNNPQIAICVFVENSGFGATYAAPIASLMIEKYINGKVADERKPLEDRIKNANLLKMR